ncbi:MAG: helix-turn-helix transcriptional regulator [Nitrospinota bacterium]|nr:helix-turn-helix transcriptional regulator [Nitrospinota bacterium]
MENQLSEAVALLAKAGAPACITSSTGELIFANGPMKAAIGSWEDAVYRCAWINSMPDKSCPECAEIPTLAGRCFFTREDQYHLAGAVRLSGAQGALARLYLKAGQKQDKRTINAIGALVSMGMDSGHRGLDQRISWLSAARLHSVIDTAAAEFGLGATVQNVVDPDKVLGSTAPLVLRCAVSQLLRQLALAKPVGSILVGYMPRGRFADGTQSQALVFHMQSSITGKKALKSRLGAIRFRLQSYFALLPSVTGYRTPAPDISSHGCEIEARLPIHDPIEKVAEPEDGGVLEGMGLSPRELEIVEMTRMGYDNKAISSMLEISEHTVRQHHKALYRKFGVNSRLELIFESWGGK